MYAYACACVCMCVCAFLSGLFLRIIVYGRINDVTICAYEDKYAVQ